MISRIRARVTTAQLMAAAALFIALGGTAFAVARNTIGSRQLKPNAVHTGDIKNDAVTGDKVNEGTLGTVPSAANANHANTADTATTAGTANSAFSTFHDDGLDMPTAFGTIATLSVPQAGNYVISATFNAVDVSATNAPAGRCKLIAGADVNETSFDALGNGSDDQESVAMQVVHQFTAPGSVDLQCQDQNVGQLQAFYTRITAVQVANLTNTAF